MRRLVLEGLEGEEEERIRAALGIEPGTLLRDKEVRDAMGRLEAATGGAYRIEGGPPWTIEEGPEGPTLRLRITRRRFRLQPLLSGPDNSPYRTPGGGPDPRLRGRTSPSSAAPPPTTRASTCRGAYAFGAEVFRYATGVRRSFGPDHLVTAGYERHDMTDTDDLFRRLPDRGAAPPPDRLPHHGRVFPSARRRGLPLRSSHAARPPRRQLPQRPAREHAGDRRRLDRVLLAEPAAQPRGRRGPDALAAVHRALVARRAAVHELGSRAGLLPPAHRLRHAVRARPGRAPRGDVRSLVRGAGQRLLLPAVHRPAPAPAGPSDRGTP